MQVLFNLGNGRFATPVAYDVGRAGERSVNSTTRVTAGDWNGDGETDLAFLGAHVFDDRQSEVMPMLNIGGGFVPGTPCRYRLPSPPSGRTRPT